MNVVIRTIQKQVITYKIAQHTIQVLDMFNMDISQDRTLKYLSYNMDKEKESYLSLRCNKEGQKEYVKFIERHKEGMVWVKVKYDSKGEIEEYKDSQGNEYSNKWQAHMPNFKLLSACPPYGMISFMIERLNCCMRSCEEETSNGVNDEWFPYMGSKTLYGRKSQNGVLNCFYNGR